MLGQYVTPKTNKDILIPFKVNMAKVFPIVKTDDDIPISSNLKLLGGNLNKSFLERDCGRCGEWVHYENEPHFISETTAVLRFAVFQILDYSTLRLLNIFDKNFCNCYNSSEFAVSTTGELLLVAMVCQFWCRNRKQGGMFMCGGPNAGVFVHMLLSIILFEKVFPQVKHCWRQGHYHLSVALF